MARSIIMFDMDGTLADTQAQLIDHIVRLAVADYGASEKDLREAVPALTRLPQRELFPAIWRAVGLLDEQEQRRFQEKTSAEIVTLTTLFPETLTVLDSLKSASYVLVLSTNTPEGVVDERTRRSGIREHFDFVLGTDPLNNGVSKADHPSMARERLSLSAKDFASTAVYVGDTGGDMEIAKQAGLVGIARLTGDNGDELKAAGAGYVINDLSELEPLLRRLT